MSNFLINDIYLMTAGFLINDIYLMTAGCKEHKHKIFISPKSHILAFENSYPFTDSEGDRVDKHSKYMPFLAKNLYAFKQKNLNFKVI